jgi:hypothetical protein
VTLGDADFRKSLMKMIYRKFIKNSVTICHLSLCILSGSRNGQRHVVGLPAFLVGLENQKCFHSSSLNKDSPGTAAGSTLMISLRNGRICKS